MGSTFESGVLKAIGSLGGGSMRQISGEQGPRAVALDLLKEITRPALRDLKVQFEGLRGAGLSGAVAQSARRFAADHPGRYLPDGKEQSGKVIVTGREGRDDHEVRFEKTVSLAGSGKSSSEQGNSFIPRLWARMHLDYLIAQGATPMIKDDIIALSEDYHIITPYTSLLVLESDADRERFKVKRSFTMRDGEKFFKKGRDDASFELTQQQMKRAGNWRIGLRMAALRQFSGLGRDIGAIQPGNQWGWNRRMGGMGGGYSSDGHMLTLSNVNSYSGGTFINGGDLSFSFQSGLGVNKSGKSTLLMSPRKVAGRERFYGDRRALDAAR